MTFSNSMIDSSLEIILCSYISYTSKIQIIRITNIPNYYWERVVFSGQRLLFEATPSARLEIYIDERFTILVPCHTLRVEEKFASNDILLWRVLSAQVI